MLRSWRGHGVQVRDVSCLQNNPYNQLVGLATYKWWGGSGSLEYALGILNRSTGVL